MKAPSNLFVRLMMMTTSANDNEALVALRKANKILKDAGVDWRQLLEALDQPTAAPPRPTPQWESVNASRVKKYDDERHINYLFQRAFNEHHDEGFQGFLESIHLWWKSKGFLTEKQYRALVRAVEGESE